MVHRLIHRMSALILFAGIVSSAQELRLGPVMPISPPGSGVHVLLQRATTEPEGPALIVCGARQNGLTNAAESFVYASFDGGRSWRESLADSPTQWSEEASCAFGPDNRLYFATSASNTDTGRKRHPYGRMYLYASTDRGRTWGKPTVSPFMDWISMTVDPTQGEHRGQLYIAGNRLSDGQGTWLAGQPPVLRSADGGRTILAPVFPDAPATFLRSVAFPRDSIVLSDGTLVTIFFGSREEGQGFSSPKNPGASKRRKYYVELIRSKDGGRTFEDPVILGEEPQGLGISLAFDRKRSRLYAAWLGGDLEHPDVTVARSSDGGRTWTSNVAIAADADRRTVANGDLSVAVDSEGRVGLEWPGGNAVCAKFAMSTDQGRTFGKPIDLNSCDQPVTLKPESYSEELFALGSGGNVAGNLIEPGITIKLSMASLRAGKTLLLVDEAGQFHPVWAERTQLLTRSVTLGAAPVPVFDTEHLSDVSRFVQARMLGSRYLSGLSTFYADVSLVNSGSEPICAPLYIVAYGLHSDSGQVEIDNADNGLRGDGALWNMSDALEENVLRGWSTSRPRTLAFQVKNLVVHDNGSPVMAGFRVFGNTGSACVAGN